MSTSPRLTHALLRSGEGSSARSTALLDDASVNSHLFGESWGLQLHTPHCRRGSIIRFDDGHGTIVGGWSGGAMPAAPIGFRVSMDTGLRGLIDRVEALGGRLEVQSPVDRGTTLRTWLPEI